MPFAKLKITITDYDRIDKDKKAVKRVEHLFVLNNPKTLTRAIINKLEVLILSVNAKTLQINFEDNNQLKAYEIVNSLIHEFSLYTVSKKKRSSLQILNFLNAQIETVDGKQKSYEHQIQNFRQENNITDVDKFSAIFAERMNKMDEAQVELELQISTLNEIKSQIEKGGEEIDIYKFLPMLMGTEYESSLAQVVEHLNQLLLKRQERLYSLKSGSAPIKEIDYQIQIQKRLITESINSLINKYKERLESLKTQSEATQQKYINQPSRNRTTAFKAIV